MAHAFKQVLDLSAGNNVKGVGLLSSKYCINQGIRREAEGELRCPGILEGESAEVSETSMLR